MNFSRLSLCSNKLRVPYYSLAIFLICIGFVSWYRLPDQPVIIYPSHGELFLTDDGVVTVGPRPDLCNVLNESNGYLLISGSINLTKIGLDQGFFQTADEENGIYLDIDQRGQVRLGIHLLDGTTGQVQFRHKYRTGSFNYTILIGADSTVRIVGDQNDIQVQFDDVKPECSNLLIGGGNEMEASEAHVIANISAGVNLEMANAELDAYAALLASSQNPSTYKWAMYTGVLMLMLINPIQSIFVHRRLS